MIINSKAAKSYSVGTDFHILRLSFINSVFFQIYNKTGFIFKDLNLLRLRQYTTQAALAFIFQSLTITWGFKGFPPL